MTLTEFLLARLAEDETVARAADPAVWVSGIAWEIARVGRSGAEARHIARHDPARVLADCGVKRQIAYAEGLTWVMANTHVDFINSAEQMGHVMRNADTRTIRLLASSFCDHPDYDESWRP